MSRLAAVLLLIAPLLAACDSSEPGDRLVGTWTLNTIRTDLVVTSSTAQTLADFSATPTGAISVSGAVTRKLSILAQISSWDGGNIQAVITSAAPVTDQGSVSALTVYQDPNGASVEYFDAPRGQYFNEYMPQRTAIQVSGARLTVLPTSIHNGDESVIVGGTLTFPSVAIPAGQPTPVPTRNSEGLPYLTTTFDFEEDGTFVTTEIDGNQAEARSGTWEIVTEGRVRIGVVDGSVTEYVTFDYEIEGETLQLSAAGIDGLSSCDAYCLRQVETEIFAAPNSLTAAELVSSFSLRSGPPGAAARVAPEGPARRVPFSEMIPLLGGHQPPISR